jgi:hypothetical protein
LSFYYKTGIEIYDGEIRIAKCQNMAVIGKYPRFIMSGFRKNKTINLIVEYQNL